MSLQGQLTGNQKECPRVLLLDLLMGLGAHGAEALEGGCWLLLLLVTLVRPGLLP